MYSLQPMQEDMFRHWIHSVFATQDEEIDCGQLFEALSQFVDMDISGQDAARLLPYVQQHLDICPECEDLFEALREIVQLEAENRLPDVDELLERILGAMD